MKHYINGDLIEGKGKTVIVINPATEEIIESFQGVSSEQAVYALESAKAAFPSWSELTILERGEWIGKLCNLLDTEKETLCQLMMSETGKPRSTAAPEVMALSSQMRYFFEEAKSVTDEMIKDYRKGIINQIIKKPVGVILAHLAWNFPLMNVVYKLGPALATGCTIVIKPAAKTPLSTLYLGELLNKINFPKGVVNIISGLSSDIAEPLNSSKIPNLITMIGSSQSGRELMKQASTSIKKYSLELGGNAPAIILEDANVKEAAIKMTYMKFMNAGQVCVTPNRIFVHKNLIDQFVSIAKEMAAKTVFGTADDEAATMGPMISKTDRDRMIALIDDAVMLGAKIVCGGGIPKEKTKGFYFEPTILTGISPKMRVYKEEIFGPIMGIMEIDDSMDILSLANDTEYGLAAFLYTTDMNKAHIFADKIEAGTVCINEPRFDINLPHGGIKESGIGKDCSKYCLEEYFYLKRISYKI